MGLNKVLCVGLCARFIVLWEGPSDGVVFCNRRKYFRAAQIVYADHRSCTVETHD